MKNLLTPEAVADLDWMYPTQQDRKALISFINESFEGTSFADRMARDSHIAALAPNRKTREHLRALLLRSRLGAGLGLKKTPTRTAILWLLNHHAPLAASLHLEAIALARVSPPQ
ncbi:hypothetical protein CcrBL47_gp495 [Caulobacter phage BL47]|nr:hypothetical protein CcrBL47_gp495 [Caulobacter phage BL47]UTU10333.1 hypothetical protein CcrRB23_gp471 [Caulobacter phage RB23]